MYRNKLRKNLEIKVVMSEAFLSKKMSEAFFKTHVVTITKQKMNPK